MSIRPVSGLNMRGGSLRERVEGGIKCRVLNRMVSLGMPVSERMY